MRKVEKGDKVKAEYQASLMSGQIISQGSAKRPLVFVVGDGSQVKGVEEAVLGMEVNQERTVTIPPEKGFGVTKGTHPLACLSLMFWVKILEIGQDKASESEPSTTGKS